MEPGEIEGRDFLVGLRGYDRDEVDAFLREVAEQQRRLQAELDALRASDPASADPFESLGTNVTNILRTAKESAEAIVAEAQRDAEALLAEAHDEAERIRTSAQAEGEALRADARNDADGIIADARERASTMEAEAEHVGRQRALAAADEATARLAEAARQQEVVRSRLTDAGDEIQLALLALGDPTSDASTTIREAVLEG